MATDESNDAPIEFDEKLRSGLIQGSEEAFARLYDGLATPMWRVARKITRSHADADDAVNQCFLNLLGNRRELAAALNPRAYAFCTLRRAAIDLSSKRVRQRAQVSHQREDMDDLPAAPVVEQMETDGDLAAALASLLPEQREVLTLKLEGQLTFVEIAEVLSIPMNTAASRYRYALEKLRVRLGGQA